MKDDGRETVNTIEMAFKGVNCKETFDSAPELPKKLPEKLPKIPEMGEESPSTLYKAAPPKRRS
jgi:hypothetical protein